MPSSARSDDLNAIIAYVAQRLRALGRADRAPLPPAGGGEREHACRAGTVTPFYTGETITTDLASYVGEHTCRSELKGVYRYEAVDVGSLPPNAFGLYDMHGSVKETT